MELSLTLPVLWVPLVMENSDDDNGIFLRKIENGIGKFTDKFCPAPRLHYHGVTVWKFANQFSCSEIFSHEIIG